MMFYSGYSDDSDSDSNEEFVSWHFAIAQQLLMRHMEFSEQRSPHSIYPHLTEQVAGSEKLLAMTALRLAKFKEATAKADQNALELMAEEENCKRKAEKKKLKKERQKDKKKLDQNKICDIKDNLKNKVNVNKNINFNTVKNKRPKNTYDVSNYKIWQEIKYHNYANASSKKKEKDDDCDSSLDMTSAFASGAVGKMKPPSTTSERKDSGHEAEVLANRGFKAAEENRFTEAIQLFTQAIRMSPNEDRYLGNRSYCYCEVKQFKRALRDAERAIKCNPDNPKGYFRKGAAHMGLNEHELAEAAFESVLAVEPKCEDAIRELATMRATKLLSMGFSEEQVLYALRQNLSLQEALKEMSIEGSEADNEVWTEEDNASVDDDSEDNNDDHSSNATNGIDDCSSNGTNDIDDCSSNATNDNHDLNSKEARAVHHELPTLTKKLTHSIYYKDVTGNNSKNNPSGGLSLWLGNITPDITEGEIIRAFSKFGPVTGVRLLSTSECAFVNFSDEKSAGLAMDRLQGQTIAPHHPKPLIIKYPITSVKGSSEIPNELANNCLSLWVGNINASVTEKQICSEFSKYGTVTSIRLILESQCAFVNFSTPKAAALAMSVLQGRKLNPQHGNNLLIKYPTKAFKHVVKTQDNLKPVGAEECYFWRTTGCFYDTKCNNLHLPEHKGIAAKVIQKNK